MLEDGQKEGALDSTSNREFKTKTSHLLCPTWFCLKSRAKNIASRHSIIAAIITYTFKYKQELQWQQFSVPVIKITGMCIYLT